MPLFCTKHVLKYLVVLPFFFYWFQILVSSSAASPGGPLKASVIIPSLFPAVLSLCLTLPLGSLQVFGLFLQSQNTRYEGWKPQLPGVCQGLQSGSGQAGEWNSRHLLLLLLLSISCSLSYTEIQEKRRSSLHVKSTFWFFHGKSINSWYSLLCGKEEKTLRHWLLKIHVLVKRAQWFSTVLLCEVMAEAETILIYIFPPKFQRWPLLHFSLAVSHSTATYSRGPAYPAAGGSHLFFWLRVLTLPLTQCMEGFFFLCWQLLCEHDEHEQPAISGQQSRELGLKSKVQRYWWGGYTEEKYQSLLLRRST